ncbi:PH domain-containing protein [Bacteroides caccae]|nr:PH domain-containing protein [Bacteroides caccae]MCS2251165.1 PH domain-containing protein [Bacteroides fragilis]MCS2274754.1 PH domain-containing protein [Bacteroides caccae]MCZ2725066.1 PH domain-containing protein [Bacteroides caccae]UVP83554.1 PH domain-containing protein [Bacteroides caccae]UVQ08352.1 PH domain-containing protein [Bacteroides caccae]
MLIVIPSFICLEKDQLVIKRVFGKKCIPYSCIKNAFVYDGVQNDVRYFGSNGFWGI